MKAMGMFGMVALFAALAVLAYFAAVPATFSTNSICTPNYGEGKVDASGAICYPLWQTAGGRAADGGNYVVANDEHNFVDVSQYVQNADVSCVGVYTELLDNNALPLTSKGYSSITCPGTARLNGGQLWCAVGPPTRCVALYADTQPKGFFVDQHTIWNAFLQVRFTFTPKPAPAPPAPEPTPECSSNLLYTCPDGSVIVQKQCVSGYYVTTGEVCPAAPAPPGPAPPGPLDPLLIGAIIAVIMVLVIIIKRNV